MDGKCIFCGNELTTGDIDSICNNCKNVGFDMFPPYKYVPTSTGWICPRCGIVNSPHVLKCDCSPPTITTGGTDIKI